MTFKTVKKGDEFKPNAKLTNETIKVINAFHSINGFRTKTKPKNTTNIEVLVTLNELSVFSPIRITSLNSQALSENNLFAKCAYKAYSASDGNKDFPLAILQDNSLGADRLIKALLIGVSPAKINITDEDHMYADTTNDGKFTSAESGEVRILHKPEGTGEKWCTVILGGGGAVSGDSYKGYFKVVKDGETFNIVDGANPDAANCGYIVAGNSRIAVPKVSGLSVETATSGAFYLETIYTTNYQVSIKFATSLPTSINGKDIKLIADLSDSEAVQRLFGEHTIARWV